MDTITTTEKPAPLPPPWDTLIPFLSKLLVWGLLFGVIYLLHSFFLLIFLTFVFAYIQSSGVTRLKGRIPNRSLRVVLVALVLLGMLIAAGSFLAPQVVKEAKLFVRNLGSYLEGIDHEVTRLGRQYPMLLEILPQFKDAAQENRNAGQAASWEPANSPAMSILEQFFGLGDEKIGREALAETIETARNIGANFFSAVSAFLLSLLFSFLIVLDLPRLTRSVRDLRNTRLRFLYEEAAGNVYNFSRVLGRALEAQFFIALCNTALTALGIFFLGLSSKVAFLSVIVFLCSFIPVAGVFISSVPICLLALQSSGFGSMLLAIGLITLIHLIEAYILNPKIYGSHMRMNPVVVLIILTIGGTLFGVWGLVLGVPVCTYIFGHAIRYQAEQ